jgi:hypothetical protein
LIERKSIEESITGSLTSTEGSQSKLTLNLLLCGRSAGLEDDICTWQLAGLIVGNAHNTCIGNIIV